MILVGLAGALGSSSMVHGAEPPSFPRLDFRQARDSVGWQALHDLSRLEPSPDGLRIEISGPDPYLQGPPLDFPPDRALWLRIRVRSEQGGSGQVFFFPDHPSEENSIRFPIPPGDWHEAKVRVPPLGPGWRLRFDPPGDGGLCLLESLAFEERRLFTAPPWPRIETPVLGARPVVLSSGEIVLSHGPDAVGAFVVDVAGRRMATGNGRAKLGYVKDGDLRWADFGHGTNASVRVNLPERVRIADAELGGTLQVEARFTDPDGGQWEVSQSFAPAPDGTVAVSTRVRVDVDRDVLHLPMFTLLSGLGSYGTNKTQALFPGLEYLENEPSSSTADLNAPASNRQVPDRSKITIPLMIVAADDRYVGLSWNPAQDAPVAAVFDSPDRLYGSGAQVMGLLLPGSDGMNRDESQVLPYEPMRLRANRSVTVGALIVGGQGNSVVPALQQHVRIHGLPALPRPSLDRIGYYRLAARGWLDSKAREGDLFRHAYWPGFNAQPAMDAALQMTWLADRVGDEGLAGRLRATANQARQAVPAGALNGHQVGHVRFPLPALIFGSLDADVAQSRGRARGALNRFEADGVLPYRPGPQGPNYGRTHWSNEANGLTGQVVAGLLEDAAFAGDRELLAAGLRHLRALLSRSGHSVPRGAQTWEIPLHTPDILASAHLVEACVLGFELTGDRKLLEAARYWAWTGVPFVYLTPPTDGAVGLYNTIAVLGATAWVAPVWLGQPVQWCGLVYAAALQRLARHDTAGPWRQLADGIAVGGIQHTWPETDVARGGLLPDFFLLRPQQSDGPAINPATVFLPAMRMWGESALYDRRITERDRILIHAPGEIQELVEGEGRISFRVRGWYPGDWWLLINGLQSPPEIRVDGLVITDATRRIYDAGSGQLRLKLSGDPHLELRWQGRRTQ